MKKIFADTGYWITLLNPEDDLHQKARQIAISSSSTQIVTSQMIFIELLNAFSGKGNSYRKKAVRFIQHSLINPEIEVII